MRADMALRSLPTDTAAQYAERPPAPRTGTRRDGLDVAAARRHGVGGPRHAPGGVRSGEGTLGLGMALAKGRPLRTGGSVPPAHRRRRRRQELQPPRQRGRQNLRLRRLGRRRDHRHRPAPARRPARHRTAGVEGGSCDQRAQSQGARMRLGARAQHSLPPATGAGAGEHGAWVRQQIRPMMPLHASQSLA